MIGNLLGSGRQTRILRLLDLERDVILNGPLSGLEPLVARREAEVEEISANPKGIPESFLETLRTKAERNSRLLLASLAGIKAAEQQITAVTEAHENLRTYAHDGKPVDVRQPVVTRDQRS